MSLTMSPSLYPSIRIAITFLSSQWCHHQCILSSILTRTPHPHPSRCQAGSAPVLVLTEFAIRLISLDPSKAPVYILESACKFLGSITFLMVRPVVPLGTGDQGSGGGEGAGGRGSGLFFPALQFLFCVYACDLTSPRPPHPALPSASAEVIERVASKSAHQLCVKGSHLFRDAHDPFVHQKAVSLVEMTAQILSSRCERSEANHTNPDRSHSSDASSLSLLLLIEAATRTIAIAVPDVASARSLMSILGAPVIVGLTHELDPNSRTVELNKQKVELLLGTATQMIKFSDQTTIDQGLLIGEFLQLLFPLLKRIPGHSVLGVTASVTNELFSLYRSAILSAKALVLSELCSIAGVVVGYLHASLGGGMREGSKAGEVASSSSSSATSLNSNSNAHALQCASSVVEALANQADGQQMLSTLLEQITEAVFSVLQTDYQQHQQQHQQQQQQQQGETTGKLNGTQHSRAT